MLVFFRYLWMFLLPDEEAATVANILRRHFLFIGMLPEALQSDNGTQFTSDLLV